MSEIVALVEPDGTVCGSAPRSVVRRDNLWHAGTGVLVRDSARRIFVHRRSPDKDWAPGCHDAAAGGVLRAGEEPEASARRELAEELGISGTTLLPLGVWRYADDSTRCVEHVYETTWDGPVTYPDAEVVWGDWMTLPTLDALLSDPAFAFVPDTRQLLTGLARAGVADYAELAGLRGP